MVKQLRAPLILLMVLGMSIFLSPCGVFAQAPTTPTQVFVDIKPGSCPNPVNVTSRGVLPVAILGTVDFDVKEIDPLSIYLYFGKVGDEDVKVSPILRASIEDVATPFVPAEGEILSCGDCTDTGPDGIYDLTLKFRTQDVVAALEKIFPNGIPDEECVTITLEGTLKEDFGATSIVGEDVVRILKKGRGNKPNIPNRPNWPPPNWPPFANFPVQ
ncbi:MAG: hypothetical protein FJ110_07600 [Deltaproteobacteria bacterium]|nr:hypothetical protein [Deltaproteobacteria bacterium]